MVKKNHLHFYCQSVEKNEGLGTFWIAKALHNRYSDNFVCTNPDRNEWYEFKENRSKNYEIAVKIEDYGQLMITEMQMEIFK